MSLDQNLFTLHFTPHAQNPNVIDLVDPSGIIHYRKQRVAGPEYKIEVYDPLSESLLATATSPSPTSKVKSLELCNPTSVVELKHVGTLSFKWAFKWEGHDFEWKREECFMIRKPDPAVIIAVTKETTGRLKTNSVQILDYNLNRFDIDDRKGLEIVILTALLTFQDYNEACHSPDSGSAPPSNAVSRTTSGMVPAHLSSNEPLPPPPPPKPAPKTGIDRVAEMQAIKGEYNEIIISDEGNILDYAEYCNKLLQDDAMLFITIISSEAEQVPKVLQVVEETKRIRHKAGLSEEEELHQYVLYDTQEVKKGPRIIKLDDDPKKAKYTPPENLTVHLSKISMPELQPKGTVKEKSQKDLKKKEEKKAKTPIPSPPPSSPTPNLKIPPNKLLRPGHPVPPNPPKVHAHQVHPNQPSPSPAQLNNPLIYTAPPPSHASRPSTGSSRMSFPESQISSFGSSPSSSSYSRYSPANPHVGSSNFPSTRRSRTPSPPTQPLNAPGSKRRQ